MAAQTPPAFGLAPRTSLSLFSEFAKFVSSSWLKIIVLSGLALVPCFWHREIAAGDLGSHLYNAWLAQLIERGQITGLKIASQWNNVLFDWLLAGLGKTFSLYAAEKIAVATAVLIFFWGTFAFTWALAGRVSWSAVPCLLMLTYGWTFAAGFFNYYLSLGLSFLALAIFLKGRGWERAGALLLVPFVILAHPLGLVWLIGASVYIVAAERMSAWAQIALTGAAVCGLVLVRVYLQIHFKIGEILLHDRPLYNGADQLIFFGTPYWALAAAFVGLAFAVLVIDIRHQGLPAGWEHYRLILLLYVLIEAAIFLIPDSIWVPSYQAPVGFVTARLTSISAVLICCLIAAARPKVWQALGFSVIAICFFGLLYVDTNKINHLEEQVGGLVRSVPEGSRILSTIREKRHWRISRSHLLDRACIGHCFSYGNYEPATGQFRIRVESPNPYQLMEHDAVLQMETGKYVLKPQDLPAYQLYECDNRGSELCLHALSAGELNNAVAAEGLRDSKHP